MAQIRKALIKNGIVENIAVFDADNTPDWAVGWTDAPDDADIGYQFDGVTFAPKVLTAEEQAAELAEWRSNATLSRRQFCIAAYRAGLLSEADAVLAAKGEWPASFDAALVGLPANLVTEAKIEWAAVSEIRRTAPLLETVRQSAGVTEDVLDTMFGYQA